MKHPIIKSLAIILILTCFSNCVKDNGGVENNTSMNNFYVPSDFNFESTRSINLSVNLPLIADYSEFTRKIEVYQKGANQEMMQIHSGSADNQGSFNAQIVVPAYTNQLFILSFAGWRTVDLNPGTKSLNGSYNADYNDNYGDYPPDTTPDNLPSTMHSPAFFKITKNGSNYLGDPGFETHTLINVNSWSSEMSVNERWYATDYLQQYSDIKDIGGNKIVDISYNRTIHGGIAQLVEAEEGEEFSLSTSMKGDGSNQIVWLYLIPRNSNYQVLNFFNYRIDNPSNEWTQEQMTAIMPANTAYCEVLLWVNCYNSGDLQFDDAVLNIKGRMVDSDGDGIGDEEDDYPDNPDLAFNSYYPSINGFGTLAFEDLWPSEGDYDFNDLVIDYRFNHVKDANNLIRKMDIKFIVRAIGASIHNGFGLQLDVAPNLIEEIISDYEITDPGYNFSNNGTESGHSLATILVFEDAYKILKHPGTGTGVNTNPENPWVEPVELNTSISFTEGISIQELGNAPNNPFIFRSKDRSWEVHLPGYPPTDLADESKFGTYDDNTNPSTGIYYKTPSGLPWGMNTPSQFVYPTEKSPIVEGHLKFRQWAESGGYSFMDWFENIDGYRNNAKLFMHKH